jgi:Ca-activated chloride channel family protein
MSFAHPYLLALLAALPLVAWGTRIARRRAVAPLPTASIIGAAPLTWRAALGWLPTALRLGAVALLVGALARPQESQGWTTTSTEGIAIQILLDRSGSMREPISDSGDVSKIELARRTVTDFVKGDGRKLKGRPGDMVGMIAFARFADTLAPLARSHQALLEAVGRVQPAQVRGEDGTAIGDGLALAAARLKRAEEDVSRHNPKDGSRPEYSIKSKVIVLMTDGENNCGDVSPYDAAAQAKDWGIRVYTIGVGAGERYVTVDTLMGPQRIPAGDDVDERMLQQIAETTGGSYFRAGTPDALANAYAAIDRLETSKIDSTQHTAHTELFAPLGVAALVMLGAGLLLSATAMRRVS